LLSGVAVTGLQDVIDNFHNANISRKKEDVTLLLLYINQRSLAPFARRLGRSGAVYMAPRPSGGGLFRIPYCMHGRQDIKET
jgi:hypothetical protein